MRTLQRWRSAEGITANARAAAGAARTPANRLDAAILAVANHPEFAHQAPNQIVPALADQGIYIASASNFYRVLRAAGQLARRGKARAPTQRRPAPLRATAPNPLRSVAKKSRRLRGKPSPVGLGREGMAGKTPG